MANRAIKGSAVLLVIQEDLKGEEAMALREKGNKYLQDTTES